MPYILMTDPATGKVGVFLENGTGGSPSDPLATRNLPLSSPLMWLANIKLHVDLDYLEVAFAGSVTPSAYPSIPGNAAPANRSASFDYDAGTRNDVLFTHSLGYLPDALVVANGIALFPGTPLPGGTADGGQRYATPKVSTTTLEVSIIATIGATTMVAQSVTYSYLIFKAPPAASSALLIDFDETTGIVTLGRGKFVSSRPYAQIVSGGSPFAVTKGGKNIDTNNGAYKIFNPDGTNIAPIPSGLKSFFPFVTYDGVELGGEPLSVSLAYGGSYAGPTGNVLVQAP